MALLKSLNFSSKLLRNNINLIKHRNEHVRICYRSLYSHESLRLDTYLRERVNMMERYEEYREKYLGRIRDHLNSAQENPIFTDDVKVLTHTATDDTIDLVVDVIRRYHKQNLTIKLGSFNFGPIVMRMFHVLKAPNMALDFFKDDEMKNFFNHVSAIVTLLDLLYENALYEECIEVVGICAERNTGGFKYATDGLNIMSAACLKLNTPEAYSKLLAVLEDCSQRGSKISNRLLVYGASLALKQNDANQAMEILSMKHENRMESIAFTNMKMLCYLELGRYDDIFLVLTDMWNHTKPSHKEREPTVFRSVLNSVETRIYGTKNEILKTKFLNAKKNLEFSYLINDNSFEDYIFQPISTKKPDTTNQNGFNQRRRSSINGLLPRTGNNFQFRPSLKNMTDETPY